MSKLCVDKLCDDKLCVEADDWRRTDGRLDTEPKTRTPHKDVGKKKNNETNCMAWSD